MARITSIVVTALVAGPVAVSASPAVAQQPQDGVPVAELRGATTIDEYAGHVLLSRFDGERYTLGVWHDGEVRDLRVRAQREVFDADAGPDSAGRPSAVVSLCDGSCDLYVIGFGAGDRLRPVRNANTDEHDEVAPSVWKGRLAFGRRYGKDTVVPYTKPLRAPRSRPSDRLAGLPAKRCGAVDPPDCRPIADVTLEAMDLWGRWVGQSWTYQPDGFPGFRQNEVRLTDVARSDTRQVAAMVTGLGGQTYLGPSLVDGRVAFFRGCQGDPAGCTPATSGALRYRISTGDYEIDGANEAWSGWAWAGTAAFHVPSAYACSGGDPGAPPPEPCALYRDTSSRWTPIDGTRVR